MVVFSPCMDCKNFTGDRDKLCCKAYPNEIPNNIFFDGSGMLCKTINKGTIHFESIYNSKDLQTEPNHSS